MKSILPIIFCLCALILVSSPLVAQEIDWKKIDIAKLSSRDKHLLSDMYDMSLDQLDSLKATGHVPTELEKLLNSMIAVASKKTMTYRQAPNIITLITREEIMKMGARDMIDVLRLVPGFHLVLDQEGKVGLGVRGNVGSDGKVLLLLDGQMLNEVYGGTFALGNHFPVDLIEKIEIIRGPGSATYGGFAEYGVINIVTREQNGLLIGGTIGQWADTGRRARETYYGSLGLKWDGGKLNFSYYGGTGQRSEGEQFGYFNYNGLSTNTQGIGRVASLAGNSAINPEFYNAHLQLGNFHIRNITDLYQVQDASIVTPAGDRPFTQALRSNNTELKYELNMFKKRFRITPKVQLGVQAPQLNVPMDSTIEFPRLNQLSFRALANATMSWDITHRINLTGGAETWMDAADYESRNDVVNVSDSMAVYNAALFGELVILTDFVNITAGLRYDNYLLPDIFADSSFESSYESYAPRIALTKRFGRGRTWHVKLLGSGAFRAPSIGNVIQAFDGTYEVDSTSLVQVGKEIEPEQSLVLEAEIGKQITQDMILTANVFRVHTRNPIVYHFYQDQKIANAFGENRGLFVYQNFPSAGSYGLELDFRYRRKRGHFHANYSFYSVEDNAVPAPYAVSTFAYNPEDRKLVRDNLTLGFPKHKVNVNAGWNLSRNLSINLTGTYLSERYAYEMVPASQEPFDLKGELKTYPQQFLVNGYINYQNFIFRGLTIGAGVYDVFNQKTPFLQPFFGLNPSLPGPSREVVVKASFDLNFDKRKHQKQQIQKEQDAPSYFGRGKQKS